MGRVVVHCRDQPRGCEKVEDDDGGGRKVEGDRDVTTRETVSSPLEREATEFWSGRDSSVLRNVRWDTHGASLTRAQCLRKVNQPLHATGT